MAPDNTPPPPSEDPAPRPEPRPETEIFQALRRLTATPGFAHIIAYLCARDNFTVFSGDLTAEDLQPMYSRSRIIRTEMSVLIGLMVQARPDYDAPPPANAVEVARQTEALLVELHDSFNAPMRNAMQAAVLGDGPLADLERDFREPIFYGGEGGFPFQCCALAAEKYRADEAWLLEHKGASIDHMIAVAQALDGLVTEQVLKAKQSGDLYPGRSDLLPAFMVRSSEVAALFGMTAEAVTPALTALTLGASDGNPGFQSLDDYNAVNGTPILDAGADRFLMFHFNALAEALYETPFYWMGGDASYSVVLNKHRGDFTEAFALRRLADVFGEARVYRGVTLSRRKGDTISDIDTLVLFADRAIVLQAKSKRLTQAARRGADLQLRKDFAAAVQKAHDQAMDCAENLLDPAVTLITSDGEILRLEQPVRHVYPVCLVADHYPALHAQTSEFLKTRDVAGVFAPLVIDVFTLDALCEMLDRPLRLLSYLDLRARYGAKVIITHEMTLLAYHLKYNLWLEDGYDLVVLEDDFAADLEIAMAARRIGLPGTRTPRGILTVMEERWVDQILAMIEDQPHEAMVELGLRLYELSEDALTTLADGMEGVLAAARKKGRSDFSIAFGGTGLSVHANSDSHAAAAQRLEFHCLVRKYDTKSERWFGLSLDAASGHVRTGGKVEFPWEPDPAMDEAVALFGSSRKPAPRTGP